ncbi:uncharacterized protein [Watersipora subatra]|uniref:uncharacterized protein n=1 Tax=Watersipora subatra TaxID=2589382 RepID=UPI00355B1A63
MLVKRLLANLLNTNKQRKSPWAKLFLHHIKVYKRSGIKLKEAMFISPEGASIVREGDVELTSCDIQRIQSILINGDACTDVLHLEKLYYCVKELSDRTMVLFNGAHYIIACLSPSNHLLILSIKARRPDGARSVTWMQSVAKELKIEADPQ